MGETRSLLCVQEPMGEEAYKSGSVQYIDSREVAEIVGKEHDKLRRDIRRYNEQLDTANFGDTSGFWLESTYKDSCGRTQKCYLVTKKGCEFIAHKLTGIKGTKFTATYINRFHEMEGALSGGIGQGVTAEQADRMIDAMEKIEGMFGKLSDRVDALEKGTAKKEERACIDVKSGPEPYVIDPEHESRKKELYRLVKKTAKLCGWSRNYTLHRVYRLMEDILGISLDDWVELYKEETQRDACALDAVVASEKLYAIALRICNTTISKLSVEP